MSNQIIEAGRKLAKLNNSHPALISARQWWKAGCLCSYSNQDFDILQSLVSGYYEEIKKQQQVCWGARLAASC